MYGIIIIIIIIIDVVIIQVFLIQQDSIIKYTKHTIVWFIRIIDFLS